MTFNIGQQHGGVINNVGRDQVIHGGQHGMLVSAPDVRQAFAELRAALAHADLPAETIAAAGAALDDAADAADRPQPDQKRTAGALERLTRLLVAAGPLSAAAAAIAGPLETLGRWLGPLGAQLLKLLPALLL